MIRTLLIALPFLLLSLTHAADKLGRVEIFVSTDCPIANAYAPEFSRLHKEFDKQRFEFLLVYPDLSTSETEIAEHREEYSLSVPGITDPDHKRVKAASASITPEVAVFDSRDQLVYRGRIGNLFNDYGDKRRVTTEHYLRAVLEKLVEGKSLSFTETKAIGCFIEPLN